MSYPATTKLSTLKPLTALSVPATTDIMYVYIGSVNNSTADTTFGWGRKATYNPTPPSSAIIAKISTLMMIAVSAIVFMGLF